MQSINHIIAKEGNRLINPLLDKIFREWDRSYIILAHENIPDEQIPWEIIIIIAPDTPHIE